MHFVEYTAERKRHSQAHTGAASPDKGAWRKFIGACIGGAIDKFPTVHGYMPDLERLKITVTFSTHEVLIRVEDEEE